MATKDSGDQRRRTREPDETEEAPVEGGEDVQERHENLTEDVDDILEDIDDVLEVNAEEFVRSYVQKGGE